MDLLKDISIVDSITGRDHWLQAYQDVMASLLNTQVLTGNKSHREAYHISVASSEL